MSKNNFEQNSNRHLYDSEFYSELERSASSSAREMAPYILSLLAVNSVVDIGCGTGDWLSVFRENGVPRIIGLDGDYVDPQMLKIDKEDFHATDLFRPFSLNERFDLAMSLEVAEHLPETSAVHFVESITNLAPVILFSAAIPHQEGTCHINEQWMDYWIGLFKGCGFIQIDCLRWLFWENKNVAWWYKQNALIFVEESRLHEYPRLEALREQYKKMPVAVVHPDIYLYHVSKAHGLEERISKKIDNPFLKVKRVFRRLLMRDH